MLDRLACIVSPSVKTRRFFAALLIAQPGATNALDPVQIEFEDVSHLIPARARYGEYGVSWGDHNNDDRLDLIFMGHGTGALALQQLENGTFKDVSLTSGIGYTSVVPRGSWDMHGASCSDFDNDGKLDLYIAHGAKQGTTGGNKFDELLRGRGDFRFDNLSRSTSKLNRYGRGRLGIWFDYNRDGLEDLYVLNYKSANVMYRNDGEAGFTDVTAKAGLGQSAVRAVPADFDQDGDLDLLVSIPLRLLRNEGDGTFSELGKSEFRHKGIFAPVLAWGDPDNDGDLDIFLSRYGMGNMLLVNSNGKFRQYDHPAWQLNEGGVSAGIAWGDMDNDGLEDLVNIRNDGIYVYRNLGGLEFSKTRLDTPSPAVEPYMNGDAALADYDGDGLLDIATDDRKGYKLLKNSTRSGNNWLKLIFEGDVNNRRGAGSKVWVTSSGKLLAYREYTGTQPVYRSTSCTPLHLGIGSNSRVDIRVQWLNGSISELNGIEVNQVLRITEPEADTGHPEEISGKNGFPGQAARAYQP